MIRQPSAKNDLSLSEVYLLAFTLIIGPGNRTREARRQYDWGNDEAVTVEGCNGAGLVGAAWPGGAEFRQLGQYR